MKMHFPEWFRWRHVPDCLRRLIGIEKAELPPEDSVTVSPMTVVLEARNWQASTLFKVKNNTDEILCRVCVRLTIDHPHIRVQDFTFKSQNPTNEPQAGVRRLVDPASSDFVILAPCYPESRKAKNLVIERLNPGETWQFIMAKQTPYVSSRPSIICANVVGFEKAPALGKR